MKKTTVAVLTGIVAMAGCTSAPCQKACEAKPCDAPASCAVCPSLKGEPVHPDSRNWRSLFNLNLDNAVYTKGVWFLNEKGDLTANKDEAI